MSYSNAALIYSTSRPPYPEELFSTIRNELSRDNRRNYIDLGCGTGELLIPLSECFEKSYGIDPEEKMIDQALLKIGNRRSITLIHGTAESFFGTLDDSVRIDLVTAGRSFHWMDQDFLIGKLESFLRNGGLFITLGENDGGIWNRNADWALKMRSIIENRYPHKQPFGPISGKKNKRKLPKRKLSELGNHKEYQFRSRLPWSTDQIINLYLSGSGLQEWLGNDLADFVDYSKSVLVEMNNSKDAFTFDFSLGMTIVKRL